MLYVMTKIGRQVLSRGGASPGVQHLLEYLSSKGSAKHSGIASDSELEIAAGGAAISEARRDHLITRLEGGGVE